MFFKSVTRGVNHWWRYAIGLLVVMLGYMIGQIPLVLAVIRSLDQHEELAGESLNSFFANPDFEKFHINSNMGYMLMLTMFVFGLLSFYAVFKSLHKRPFRTLISWKNSVDWKKMFFGFFIWLALGIIFETVMYFINPEIYTFQYRWQVFIPLVLLSLFVLPLQTTLEEVVFRGYLLQGFGLVFKNKWMPWIITSVLFGLLHSMNPEIDKFGFWTMQVYYITAGLLLGLICILDNGLELSLGVHAATNFIGAVFLGYEGAALTTESLFTVSEVNPLLVTLGLLISGAIFILIASKCYNWPNIRSIFKPIDYDSAEQV